METSDLLKEKVKVKTLIANTLDSLSLFSYFMVVISRILLFSSISGYMPTLSSILKYSAIFFIVVINIIYLVGYPKTWRQFFFIVMGYTLALIEMYTNGLQNNFSMAIILGISLIGINCTFRRLALIQGLGMLTGSLIIVLLSFWGALPQTGFASRVYSFQSSYQETVYYYGFNHPNAFGTVITMGIILLSLGKGISKKTFAILLAGCVALDFVAGADTAMMAAFFMLLGVILTPFREKLYRVGYFVTNFLLLFLPLLSIWLGINANTSIGQWVSRIIAARPPIWNYYLTLNPIKLIATPPQLDFSVGNNVAGNGVLDGSYIYALVYWGILALIVILLSWKAWIPFEKHPTSFQWMILLFVFAVTVMSFPESHMLSYYENVLILGFGLFQFNSNKRKLLINEWQFEKEHHENIN